MEREELQAWLRLTLTPGVGLDSARKLLAAFGLPEQVFGQTAAALRQVVNLNQATALLTEPADLAERVEPAEPAEPAGGHERHERHDGLSPGTGGR